MMNRNERMEKLNNAGINTGKYFNLNVEGVTITLTFDENGQPVVVNNRKEDEIYDQIIESGYVRNTKLHRRFVMAQMFRMLNYVSYDRRESGFDACLRNCYGYDYTFSMMLDEVKVLSKLEAKDRESFEERSHFFNKAVIREVLTDYMDKLKTYVDTLPVRNCKGVPYKRIKGKDIFVDDLFKKLYMPLDSRIRNIASARSYKEIYKELCAFRSAMVKLPWTTKKNRVWIDAYKGSGAYYTLKNLVMYHNCKLDRMLPREQNMQILKRKLGEYQGEGWRMFALMKDVIAKNNFNFQERMNEIYNK